MGASAAPTLFITRLNVLNPGLAAISVKLVPIEALASSLLIV